MPASGASLNPVPEPGAYFSAAILLRSGIGPQADLGRLGIPVVADLPVGERLLDHCGTAVTWTPSEPLQDEMASLARRGALFAPHGLLKAASSACCEGAWDLHLVPWISEAEETGRHEANVMCFLMKPRSHGRVTLRSRDPADPPHVERGFLSDPVDLAPMVEALELVRSLARTPPLDDLVSREVRPGRTPVPDHVRSTVRGYYHPAGTCPIGDVVDPSGRVHGVDRLLVADASIMPTIPRANTNLTTAAIAERVAETI